MTESALIIIDVQLGMYNNGRIPAIYQGEEKVETISVLLEKARKKGIETIFIQHCGGPQHPLEENTEGWRIHHKLRPTEKELVIKKKYPDSFMETELNDILLSSSISNLYIVGNQTEYCIDTTCKSAFSRGFQVLLIEDCHSTWDTDILSASQIIQHHNETLSNGFATLKNSKEISFSEFEKR